MAHFVRACRKCGEDILLSNENVDNKWAAYEYDEYEESDTEFLDYHKCEEEEESSSSFLIPCKFCGFGIEMSNKSGKWLPYEESGQAHRCLGRMGRERAQGVKD